MSELRTVRVAAIQATPVILDAAASVAKAITLLEEAAAGGAELAVLPETFVPLYPSNRWARGAADSAAGTSCGNSCTPTPSRFPARSSTRSRPPASG